MYDRVYVLGLGFYIARYSNSSCSEWDIKLVISGHRGR
jgi:hypothetical protein